VGKIGITDSILLKPDKLTAEEFDLMKKHCHIGKSICDPANEENSQTGISHTGLASNILGTAKSPLLKVAAAIALTHHEKWDGSGYPSGLTREEIPIAGRITAVADVFDALSSKRPYKPALPLEQCFAILEQGRGAHFDPEIIDAFFARKDQVLQIRATYSDE